MLVPQAIARMRAQLSHRSHGATGGTLHRLWRVGVTAISLAFLALLIVAATASAAPAAPIVIQLTQPDGTVFLARQYGDETSNGVETVAGYTIARDGRGVWRYAMAASQGVLSAGLLRADAPASPVTPLHLRSTAATPTGLAALGSAPAVRSATTATETAATSAAGSVGAHADLVLLVRFLDQAPAANSTAAAWHARYFGKTNSVRDVYTANSYGAFTLVPARETQGKVNDGVVGWLSLNMKHPDTQGDAGADANVTVFRMAIAAADPFVDFASYDTDHDGFISSSELHVTVILAGYEAAYSTACGNSVWGHRSSVGSIADSGSADEVILGNAAGDGGFTEFGEQHCWLSNGVRQSHLATIGLMAHEFGHELGLPDLYDTDYSSYGIGVWSLMSLGAWNAVGSRAAGSSPAMLDPWSKSFEGWLTPVQRHGTVTLANVEHNATVVQVLANPGGVDWSASGEATGEYFLIENRQRIGYDAGLPGCGILVWHIDESRAGNTGDSRRLVDLVEADGRHDLEKRYGTAGNAGDAGDAFSAAPKRSTFAKKTAPSSALYGGKASGVSVTSIAAPCGTSAATFTITAPSVGAH